MLPACSLFLAGILRPLDLIQAYRLEMMQKFANSRGKDLYAFWGTTLAGEINRSFADTKEQRVLVNVASQEYFKSVQVDTLDESVLVVDCVFQDDGKVKSVYAKRARGLMCRFLIENRVDSVDGIKKFDLEGYEFAAKASSETTFVFNRTAAKQKAVLKEIQAKAKLAKEGQQPAKKSSVKAEKDTKDLEEDNKMEAVVEVDKAATRSTRASTRKKRKTA